MKNTQLSKKKKEKQNKNKSGPPCTLKICEITEFKGPLKTATEDRSANETGMLISLHVILLTIKRRRKNTFFLTTEAVTDWENRQ